MYKYKIKSFFFDHSNSIINVIFLFFYSYFFIAFLPKILPIETGLDPSWRYAISQATNSNFIFGKDIIFTFGPLGYLIDGAPLDENFFQILSFRWSVYLMLFIVLLIRIKTVKNPLNKLIIATAIILSLSIGLPQKTDYQILFIYLILLTFDSLFQRFPVSFPILLGSIAGVCLLTKFSLGISVIGSLTLFLIVNLIQSFQAKSWSKININSFALLNSYLATISTAWLSLYPNNFLQSLQSLIVIFSFCFLIAYFALCTKIIDRFKWFFRNKKGTPISPSSLTVEKIKIADIFKSSYFKILFYPSYTIFLIFIVIYSPHSLIDYLGNSLEISSGYSSAMSMMGNTIKLGLAVLNFFSIVILLFVIGKNTNLNLASALIFVLWIAFKHSCIRQDIEHLPLFFLTTPLIASFYIIKLKSYRELKISYYIFSFVCVSSFLILISPYIIPQTISQKIINPQLNQSNKLNPTNVFNNISSIFHTEELKNEILAISAKNLSTLQLPSDILNVVSNKPIDIIPWEVSLAPANNLNWQPRPILQSYSAYTDKLDEINFSSLSLKPRDYLFYDFSSIDQRHPFFDEPKTFFNVFCNYQPAPLLSNRHTTLSVLKKNKSTRCLPSITEKKVIIEWNQVHSVNSSVDSIIRAEIKFSYSIFGKLQKIFFRVPPVSIIVDYVDGSSQVYRIIPENSGNGVILSHLPRNGQEAVSFLKGNLPANVKSFRFETSKQFLYKPTIEINFLSNSLLH